MIKDDGCKFTINDPQIVINLPLIVFVNCLNKRVVNLPLVFGNSSIEYTSCKFTTNIFRKFTTISKRLISSAFDLQMILVTV